MEDKEKKRDAQQTEYLRMVVLTVNTVTKDWLF